MYCRFLIILFIMLLNKSKTRAVKIKRIDMYGWFCLTKKKEALKIKTSFNYGAEGENRELRSGYCPICISLLLCFATVANGLVRVRISYLLLCI